VTGKYHGKGGRYRGDGEQLTLSHMPLSYMVTAGHSLIKIQLNHPFEYNSQNA